MFACLAFYDVTYHFDVNLFDGFMLGNCDRHAAGFAKGIVTASAAGGKHLVTAAFQYLAQFVKSQIL